MTIIEYIPGDKWIVPIAYRDCKSIEDFENMKQLQFIFLN